MAEGLCSQLCCAYLGDFPRAFQYGGHPGFGDSTGGDLRGAGRTQACRESLASKCSILLCHLPYLETNSYETENDLHPQEKERVLTLEKLHFEMKSYRH